ncbi:hypothetical protein BZA77DRAFT_328771 [Pyronema omphalodes]|nr:hypothetical protein BZA77DRAFT_328771 [Pyronema omphalodes]
MSSLWLAKKKKAELISLCEELGLDTQGYLKSDLEAILSEHLADNEAKLSSDPTFSAYYETVAPRASPYESRARRRTSRYQATEPSENGDASTSPEPTNERMTRSGSRALSTRTPRTIRRLPAPIPTSPAIVADDLETRSASFIAATKRVVTSTDLQEQAISLRDRLSNVISVNAAALSIEAVLLLVAVIPVNYQLTFPAIEAVGIASTTFEVPDLFVLLTGAFWGPFLTWLATAVILPLINAFLFNLVSSVKEKEQPKVDPLTYAVTRGLVTYAVYYRAFLFFGALGEESVLTIARGVGRELQLVNAAVGAVAAIWEGILKR